MPWTSGAQWLQRRIWPQYIGMAVVLFPQTARRPSGPPDRLLSIRALFSSGHSFLPGIIHVFFEGKIKGAAAADRRLDPDFRSVHLDYFFHHRQPDACAFRFIRRLQGMKDLEDPF